MGEDYAGAFVEACAVIYHEGSLLVACDTSNGTKRLPVNVLVKEREKIDNALRRGLHEELGFIDIHIVRGLGVIEIIGRAEGVLRRWLKFIFLVAPPVLQRLERPLIPGAPQMTFEWVPLHELEKSNFVPNALATLIPQWISQKSSLSLAFEFIKSPV